MADEPQGDARAVRRPEQAADSPATGVSSFSAQPGARSPAAANLDEPFVPALSIPNAISVRLGNDALRAIAYSAPKMIAPDALTGSINDIYSSTESSGYTFSVQFSRISYAGQLERAYIKAFAPEHLNVQLALRATMTIGATYVSGAGRSAYAGPISVVIGNRYPVWLGMDVTPYVDGDKLRLRYNAARFEIPYDDWYVTAPYGVSTQGLGMTSDKVSSGLVQGIYGQKARIEQEVQSIVPFLLTKVEERLDLSEVSQVANAFWPLPGLSSAAASLAAKREHRRSGHFARDGSDRRGDRSAKSPAKAARRTVGRRRSGRNRAEYRAARRRGPRRAAAPDQDADRGRRRPDQCARHSREIICGLCGPQGVEPDLPGPGFVARGDASLGRVEIG